MFDEFVTFVKKNAYIVIAGIITALLCYGYEMTNFTMTIDEEANWNTAAVRSVFARRVADGRFSLGILKQFLPRMFLPYWSTAVFIILIVLSGILIAYLYKDYITKKLARTALVTLFISMPVHSTYVMFSIMSAETALGYLMVILSVIHLNRISLNIKNVKWHNFIPPLFLLVFSIGIYQALLMVYVILVCGLVVMESLGKESESDGNDTYKQIWKKIGGYILFLMGAGILYIIISKVLQIFVSSSRGYVESFIRWGEGSFGEILKQCVVDCLKKFCGTSSYSIYNTMPIFAVLLLSVFVIGIILCKKQYKVVFVLGLTGLVLANFLASLAAGAALPDRTFLTFPIYTAIIFALFVQYMNYKILDQGLAFLLVLLLVRQSAATIDLFWGERRTKVRDQIVMEELVSEIAELGYGFVPDKPVAIINDTSYKAYAGSFGYSYLNLGTRIYGYLEYMGFDYVVPDAKEWELAQEYGKQMPCFPADGSIIEKDDVIIVNFCDNIKEE